MLFAIKYIDRWPDAECDKVFHFMFELLFLFQFGTLLSALRALMMFISCDEIEMMRRNKVHEKRTLLGDSRLRWLSEERNVRRCAGERELSLIISLLLSSSVP